MSEEKHSDPASEVIEILNGIEASISTAPAVGRPTAVAVDVRALRQILKMSEREFARLLGVTEKSVRNWELGRSRPRRDLATLLQILQADPQQAVAMLMERKQ